MALRVEPGLSSSVPPLTPSRSADRPIDEAGTVTSSEAAEAGSPSPARRRGARLAAPVGIVGVVVGCLVPWRAAMHSGLSGDVFWQLASGRWMLDHHQILRQDVFSYTVLGRHWLTPEWGYQVLLAAAVRQLGPVAFWLLSAGTATLTVLAVTARCRRYGTGWTWTGIIALTCGAAMAVFSRDRPEMVSYLLLAVLMLILTLARSHRGWLVVVPLLCAIWANDHGRYVLALAVLVLEPLAAVRPLPLGPLVATDPLPLRAVSLTLVACVLATLVNPDGWGIYPYTIRLTFNPTIGRLIAEWQSPDFHVLVLLVLVAGPFAVTAAYFLLSHNTVPVIDLLLARALLIATLESVRFLP